MRRDRQTKRTEVEKLNLNKLSMLGDDGLVLTRKKREIRLKSSEDSEDYDLWKNSIEYIFANQEKMITGYMDKYGIVIDLYDRKIYVRTFAGCWKIVLDNFTGRFSLYHMNNVYRYVEFSEVESTGYHRQSDVKQTCSLKSILEYVRQHDEAKVIIEEDYRKLHRDSARQKMYFEIAKRRERKNEIKRVEEMLGVYSIA